MMMFWRNSLQCTFHCRTIKSSANRIGLEFNSIRRSSLPSSDVKGEKKIARARVNRPLRIAVEVRSSDWIATELKNPETPIFFHSVEDRTSTRDFRHPFRDCKPNSQSFLPCPFPFLWNHLLLFIFFGGLNVFWIWERWLAKCSFWVSMLSCNPST